MDDSKIIELYMERSEQAISETSKKYGRYCHYIAYSILHNDEDSEECVNDTYLRAWNSIPPKRPSKLQTFLGKITRNLSLNKWENGLSESKVTVTLFRTRGKLKSVLEKEGITL